MNLQTKGLFEASQTLPASGHAPASGAANLVENCIGDVAGSRDIHCAILDALRICANI